MFCMTVLSFPFYKRNKKPCMIVISIVYILKICLCGLLYAHTEIPVAFTTVAMSCLVGLLLQFVCICIYIYI